MITVNSVTRQFNVPGSDLVFGVSGDSDVERKHFQCPRYVGDGLDLAACFIRMNYRNANGAMDFYLVDDLAIDGDNITFSWLLSPRVTEYKGQVKFVMCAVGPDLKLKWHTTQGTGQVMDGLEPDNSHVESQTADVVAQLIAMVDAQTVAVEKVGAEQVANVNATAETATMAAVNEIEAKRANSLASIPNDYTSLSSTVESLTRGKAVAIVCDAEGSAVAVSDASDMPIQGMRIFGRSTQNGTPTPSAPVEIVSVENPAVAVAGKNLLNNTVPTHTGAGITYTKNEDGSITINGTATGESYYVFDVGNDIPIRNARLVASLGGTNGKMGFVVGYIKQDGTFVNSVAYVVDKEIIFTYPKDAVKTRSYIVIVKGNTFDNFTVYPMIRAQDTSADYEPYTPIQTVVTTKPLRGVPVTSGGNYTDTNGQQWICDEVDLERGAYVQRVGVRVLGASGAYRDAASQVEGFYTTYIQHNDIYLPIAERAICDKLPCYPGTSYKTLAAEGVFGNSGVQTTDVIVIRVSNDRATDVVSFNEWIKNNPITVYYPLSAPIETPLSETELAAYRNLHSNYPNTTVLNDAGAHMVVKYAADTKLYIDNKIKEALK